MNNTFSRASRSFNADQLGWFAFLGLMVLVGARHIWFLWTWNFSSFTLTLGDLGVVFPALVAGYVLVFRDSGRETLKKIYSRNRTLIFIIVGLFGWMLLRAISSGELAVFISLTAQISKAVVVLTLLIVLVDRIGTRRALNAFFFVGVLTAIVSLGWYAKEALAILPTWGGGVFQDKELWYPRHGLEIGYGKVLQFEGFAQDPVTIAAVYATSLFGGLAATFKSRFSMIFTIAGISIVMLTIVLAVSRSGYLAVVVVVLYLSASYLWHRDQSAKTLLSRLLLAGIFSVGVLVVAILIVQLLPVGGGRTYSLSNVVTMAKTKTQGNVSFRADYQIRAIEQTFSDVPTALVGNGAKTKPEGVLLIENSYLWLVYQYGLVGAAIVTALGIVILYKLKKMNRGVIQSRLLLPLTLWLGVVSLVSVVIFGISLWVLIALTLIESAKQQKTVGTNHLSTST